MTIQIFITTDLTINGVVTFDGNNAARFFTVASGANVTLNNVTLTNGFFSGAGGAISVANGGILTVNQGNFDGNQAQSNGGAIDSGGELHISQTIFQDNSAGGDGGAINQTGAYIMTINTSGFLNNSAAGGRGGAIYNSGSNIASAINAGFFDSNTASNANSSGDGGGAIYHNSGILNIFGSGFAGNNADGSEARGGAIYSGSTDTAGLGIEYSHFGVTLGIPIPLPAPLTILTMNAANTVTGTTSAAAGGGAIYNSGHLAVLGTSFIGNTSSTNGGAVVNVASVSDPPPPSVGNGVVFGNSTFTGNTATGNGGAIYQNNEDDLLQLINVTIASNTAASGGGIYNTGDGESPNISNFDDVWVVNTIIASNTGGNCAGGELGNGNSSASGNNVVFGSACDIRQQDGASTAATPFTGDPVLEPVQIAFSLPAIVTYVMPLGNNSSASATGDQAVCSAFPILNADQQGILGLTRPAPSGTSCDIGAYEVDHAPEIQVLDSTPIDIPDGGSFDFGTTGFGAPVTETFTVNNVGEDPLTLGAISVPAGFSFTTFGSTTLNAGASTTFTVTCDAGSLGTLSGTVSFSNNDGDENPFNFDVTCQVITLAPEIDVQGNAVSIADGDATPSVTDDTDFGSTTVGVFISRTYTIENLGSADLTLGAVTVPAGFTLTASPTTPVTAGNTTTFTVQCDALSATTFSGDVSIANNDSDENPYTFAITCQVTLVGAPEIAVQQGATTILDGGTYTFSAATTVGTPITTTITVTTPAWRR